MKKIVGIIAAVAMAASVFAVDITGGMKAGADLFNKEFKDGAKATVLKVGQESGGYYWGTRLQGAISGDKAGAQFALSYHGWEDTAVDLYLRDVNVWFKPIDMVKIQLMNASSNMNNSFVDDKRVMHADGAAQITVTPVAGLEIVATLANEWMKNDKIGTTAVKVAYGADFGKISAMFIGSDDFDTLAFGAGYSNKFGDVDMFADVAYTMKKDDNKLGLDAQAVLTADALTVKAFVMYTMNMDKKDEAKNDLCARLRAQYDVNGVKPYVVFACDDFIVASNTMKMTINPGVEMNCGAAALDLGVKFDINQKDGNKISVPFTVAVNF